MVYLILSDLFKIQMEKSPLVKWNIETKNGLYYSETVQPPPLNWFNWNGSVLKWQSQVLNGSACCDIRCHVKLSS